MLEAKSETIWPFAMCGKCEDICDDNIGVLKCQMKKMAHRKPKRRRKPPKGLIEKFYKPKRGRRAPKGPIEKFYKPKRRRRASKGHIEEVSEH
jgi:hypothetical protein